MTEVKLSPLNNELHHLYASDHTLIHMLEHTSDFNDKNSWLFRSLKKIDGQKIEGEYAPKKQDDTRDGFMGMAISSVRAGYPMRLFNALNTTGLMVDGSQVDYIWASPHIIHNRSHCTDNTIFFS